MFRVRSCHKATPACNVFPFSVVSQIFDMKITSQDKSGQTNLNFLSLSKSFFKNKTQDFVCEHLNGYPDPSRFGKIKGGITLITDRETPCIYKITRWTRYRGIPRAEGGGSHRVLMKLFLMQLWAQTTLSCLSVSTHYFTHLSTLVY